MTTEDMNESKQELWNLIETYAPNLSDTIGWGSMDSLCEDITKLMKGTNL